MKKQLFFAALSLCLITLSAAAARAQTTDGNDVLVYEVGGVTPVDTVSLDSGETALPRGLAWSGDQEYLFVVTRHDNDPEPHLEIERHPAD